MAHPYKDHAQDKAGKAKAKAYQSGGAVDKLPTNPEARSNWERLNQRQDAAERDHHRVQGERYIKIHERVNSRRGMQNDAENATVISDAVPRRKED